MRSKSFLFPLPFFCCQLLLFYLFFFVVACDDSNDNPPRIVGKWFFTLDVTFGDPMQASLEAQLEAPYDISVQGTGRYLGSDGSGERTSSEGMISGWYEPAQGTLYFYFSRSPDSDFSINFKGTCSDSSHINGSFNAFLKEQTWFHGNFTAVKHEYHETSEQLSAQQPHHSTKIPIIKEPSDGYLTGSAESQKDTILVYNDYESGTYFDGGSIVSFAYQGQRAVSIASGSDHSVYPSNNQTTFSPADFTRLEFWMYIDCQEAQFDREMDITLIIELINNSGDILHYQTSVSSVVRDIWVRKVIFLSDVIDTERVDAGWKIRSLSFQNPKESKYPVILDDIRFRDDRWFYSVLSLPTASSHRFQKTKEHSIDWGDMAHEISNYYRNTLLSSDYYEAGSQYDESLTDCYASFNFPFPPYECNTNNTSFLPPENKNPDWLHWEEYGRKGTIDGDTQYLFWQWNERLNRHFILEKVAYALAILSEREPNPKDAWRKEWYGSSFSTMLGDWLYDFPSPSEPLNWGEPGFTVQGDITTSLRIENWIKSMFYLHKERVFFPDWMLIDCLKSLYNTGLSLDASIISHWSPTNHTALAAYTLYSLGIFFPEFIEGGKKWREKAVLAMDGMINRDGSNPELSTHYHILIARFFDKFSSLAAFFSELRHVDYTSETAPLYAPMLSMKRYLWNISAPPLLMGFNSQNTNDYLYWVPALNDGVGTGEDVTDQIFYYKSMREYETDENDTVLQFPDAGQVVVRSGRQADDFYLLIDAGPFGIGAHGHQDKLSFVLCDKGSILICDPGGWGGSDPNWDRSAMHNTVTVDGYGQIRAPDVTDNHGKPQVTWQTDGSVFISGLYSMGYGNPPHSNSSAIIPILRVTHNRTFRINPASPEQGLVIEDTLRSSDRKLHWYRVYFHLHPDAAMNSEDLIISPQNIKTRNGKLRITELSGIGKWLVEMRPITDRSQYGNIIMVPTIVYSAQSMLPHTRLCFIINTR